MLGWGCWAHQVLSARIPKETRGVPPSYPSFLVLILWPNGPQPPPGTGMQLRQCWAGTPPPCWPYTSCSELSCSLAVPRPAVLWDADAQRGALQHWCMWVAWGCAAGGPVAVLAVLPCPPRVLKAGGALRGPPAHPHRAHAAADTARMLLVFWPPGHTAGSCSAPHPFRPLCPKSLALHSAAMAKVWDSALLLLAPSRCPQPSLVAVIPVPTPPPSALPRWQCCREL